MSSKVRQTLTLEEPSENRGDDAPNIVAYRVSQLEKAVNTGFKKQAEHLDALVQGFVTEKEMMDAKQEGKLEHDRLWSEIRKIQSWGTWAARTIGAVLIVALLALLASRSIVH